MKTWKNTELKNPTACDAVRKYCRNNGINFETSSAGYGYVHFEIFCTDAEAKEINHIIDENN